MKHASLGCGNLILQPSHKFASGETLVCSQTVAERASQKGFVDSLNRATSKMGETSVSYDETLSVGSSVKIDDKPAADGTYDLDNKVSFVVKDGKLESVISDGKDVAKEDMSAFVPVETFNALQERFTALEKALNEKLETFTAAFSQMPNNVTLEKYNDYLKQVGGVIETIAEIPFEKEVSLSGDKEDANEKFRRAGQMFAQQPVI